MEHSPWFDQTLNGSRFLFTLGLMVGFWPQSSSAQNQNRPTPKGPIQSVNVDDGQLAVCSRKPLTGYFRDGRCTTGPQDRGSHTVCATMTDEFLQFSRSKGNDLITPSPRYRFPGLKPGNKLCLCAARWYEAYRAKVAPPVHLEASHKAALRIAPKVALEKHRAANASQTP